MPPPMPQELEFASEKVPLHEDWVKERLEREILVNIYWQSNQMLWFKRANRFFPLIERILKEEGIPDDFKYLALVESGLMNVVSPAKAAGFWQILPGTARDLGLEVNEYVDERYHLEKATRAACSYLKNFYQRFGSWTLSAAAYNTGPNNISYHLETQQISSYYHMHLPEETSRYVFRILAEKTIFSQPSKYGFHYTETDLYQPLPYREVRVDTSIHNLFRFAQQQGVSYQELKRYNPWLRERKLPNRSGKEYIILLPPRSTGKEITPIRNLMELTEVFPDTHDILQDKRIFPFTLSNP